MLKRRGFVKGTGGIAVALAGLGPVAFFGASRPVQAGSFGAFSRDKFEALVGAWMHIDMGPGAGWESVQLVEVEALGGPAMLDQFEIRFRAGPGVELEPGIYAVDTGSAGAFEVFLRPAGSDASGALCAASFGLIRPVRPSCSGGSASA